MPSRDQREESRELGFRRRKWRIHEPREAGEDAKEVELSLPRWRVQHFGASWRKARNHAQIKCFANNFLRPRYGYSLLIRGGTLRIRPCRGLKL